MVGWRRDRLLVAAGLVLIVGAIGWASLIPSDKREDALDLPGFVLGLLGLLVSVIPLVSRLGQPGAVQSVTVLADWLANAVDIEWRTEATRRRLQSNLIPLRWSLSDHPVAGSLAAAIGTPGAPAAFTPLPGHIPITETYLQAGGGRSELHAVYAGLASGRIVVVGAPGAGKSGTAILLLLDALAHRRDLDNDPQQQARIPVPVLFTTHGWDPTSTSIQDWLADRLAVTYPMFAHRGGRAEAAALIAARDKIALLLDGLDEMAADLLPAALEALSDATFRVVVLTRSKEMVQAASKKRLTGAVAVRLHSLTAAEAADYLQHADLPPSGWDTLLTHLTLTHLRDHPDGAMAHALSTPLTLTLLRYTYQPDDDIRELIDLARTHPPAAVEEHLIDRVLPTAYTPRAGRPKPRYTEQQARQTLSFLARQMGDNRDLIWWHIPRWVPSTPRILVTGLVSALLSGLGLGFANGVQNGLEYEFEAGLSAGLWFGLAGALVGMVFGLTFGYLSGQRGGMPQRLKNWRDASLRLTLHSVIVGAITGWITVSFVGFIALGLKYGFMIGLAVGVPSGIAGGLVFGVLFRNTSPGSEGRPWEPRESWRNDRIFRLSGAPIGGLKGGLCAGLGGQFADGIVPAGVLVTGLWAGSAFGLTVGIPVGLMVTLVFSQSWATTLAWLQLRWSHRIPVISLIPFLEDARECNVLRTAGMSYQFRHATLQDRLISQSPQTPRHPSGFRLRPRHRTENRSHRFSALSGDHESYREVN